MKTMARYFSLLVLLLAVACASAGSEGPNGTTRGSQPGTGQGRNLLTFRLSVNPNGSIDRTGRGFYAVLINAQGTQIEATDLDTFTDFIRFDGQNFDWYHRLADVGNPGFTFVQVGNLSGQARVTPDGKTIEMVVDTSQSTNFINQFVPSNRFTAHAITTDSTGGAFLGRVLDTLGQGPNLDSNSLQTLAIQKGTGALNPFPPAYPNDPNGDFITKSDLSGSFPYVNFDIVRFEVVAL